MRVLSRPPRSHDNQSPHQKHPQYHVNRYLEPKQDQQHIQSVLVIRFLRSKSYLEERKKISICPSTSSSTPQVLSLAPLTVVAFAAVFSDSVVVYAATYEYLFQQSVSRRRQGEATPISISRRR